MLELTMHYRDGTKESPLKEIRFAIGASAGTIQIGPLTLLPFHTCVMKRQHNMESVA